MAWPTGAAYKAPNPGFGSRPALNMNAIDVSAREKRASFGESDALSAHSVTSSLAAVVRRVQSAATAALLPAKTIMDRRYFPQGVIMPHNRRHTLPAVRCGLCHVIMY